MHFRAVSARKVSCLVLLAGLLWGGSALARNFELRGRNELSGGIGFAASLTDWTPGGFKWFNDYSRELNRTVWLNFQFNVVLGGGGPYNRHNCYRVGDRWYCDEWEHWGGYALEFGAGVKLKWRLKKIPLQFHAKIGGVFDILFFDYDWTDDLDFTGFTVAFRGGFGVRYFFLPTLGVGAELMIPTIGVSFINHDVGAELYASIDFNTGIEWRF